MITLFRESNTLGIVCLPRDRSAAFRPPIFGVVLFDIFALSSTRGKSDIRAWQYSSAETGCSPRHAVRRGGRPCDVSVREVLNVIFHVRSTGCQWKALLKSTAHHYFMLWDSGRQPHYSDFATRVLGLKIGRLIHPAVLIKTRNQ